MAMDEILVKRDFARFKQTIESLAPVYNDILKHFESVAKNHFQGRKELLIGTTDEQFLRDALTMNCSPIVAFVGSSNAGKSSLLNLVLGNKNSVVPVKQQCCTARVVRLRHSQNLEGQSWCLIDHTGKRMSDPKPFKRKIPTKLIDLEEELRESAAVEQVVEGAVLSDGILSYGVELIDTPGLGESDALKNVLMKAMNNDIRPLIVFIINGHISLKLAEKYHIKDLREKYSQAEFIFVVNKSDIDDKNVHMDRSDDDEDDDGKDDARDVHTDRSHGDEDDDVYDDARDEMKLNKLKVNMVELQKLSYIDKNEEFGKSEVFHCLSSKVVKEARRKIQKGEPLLPKEKLFLEAHERFYSCLLKRLHDIMRDFEASVRKLIANVLESFLNLLGKNRLGVLKALHDMGEIINSAQRAENHLHDNRRFHDIFDNILSKDGVILHALDAAKDDLLHLLAKGSVTTWDLRDIQRDPKRKLWLSRLGLPEDGDLDEREKVEGNFETKMKAVSFVIEAELVIVNRLKETIVTHINEALQVNAGAFRSIINEARSQSVDVLSGLFDQAYRIRHGGDHEFHGVVKMHDIVNWEPVKQTVRQTVEQYCVETLNRIKVREPKETNLTQWRTEFVEMTFSRLSVDEISSMLRHGCYRRLDEMHREFTRITTRVRDLQTAVKTKGDDNIKLLESDAKPRLLLHMCEVLSIEFLRDPQPKPEVGRLIGRDGDFCIHECRTNNKWVIYVAKKETNPEENDWLKVTEHVFFADEMRKRIAKLHPHLVNCHCFWMPTRHTFNVAFDRTDSTLTEYLCVERPSLGDRLHIALKIARVLADIHSVQLSHLDLRLSNIMMLVGEPKLLHCCSKSPTDPSVVETEGKSIVIPPFHLHPDFIAKERTDAAAYMDCYAFGMLLWVLVKGSPTAYPEVFTAYDAIDKLSGKKQARDATVLPEEPQAAADDVALVKDLYKLMKLTWTNCKELRMDRIADHLEFLMGLHYPRVPSGGQMMLQLARDLRANYSTRTPYLKFLKELFVYLIYITWRNVFRIVQRGWWRINGTARTLSQVRKEYKYNNAAHVQRILWRGKADILCIARSKDFVSVHERFDDPRCVLADNVTLYSVGHYETTFVETPADMDIHHSKHATFLFMAQYLFAVRTITIPNWAFKKLADEIGDPGAEVTFLANTGRCGSTILSQMFEACPGVLSLSEPDAFTNFDVLKNELPEEEYKSLLRSSVRLLCKPHSGANIKYVLIKTRSDSVRHVPAIGELFPSINLLFMYRDRMETVRSMDQAFSAILVYWLLYVFQAFSILRKMFPKQVERCRYFCFGDDESTAWMRNSDELSSSLTIFYYLCMHHCWVIRKYYDFQEEGIDIPAVRYEDMLKDPGRACKILFTYCGLPEASIPKAIKAMEKDSQRSSPLAIDAKKKRKRHEVTPEVMEICDKFCQRSGIPSFSENEILPRTITMMEKCINRAEL